MELVSSFSHILADAQVRSVFKLITVGRGVSVCRGDCLWSSACPARLGTTRKPYNESTKHYLTQILFAKQLTLLTGEKKSTHAYEDSRSLH